MGSFLKGLGLGLIILALSDYLVMIPFLGNIIGSYKLIFFLVLGLFLMYLGRERR